MALGGPVPPPSHPLAPYEGMQKLAEGQKPWLLPQQLHLEKSLELLPLAAIKGSMKLNCVSKKPPIVPMQRPPYQQRLPAPGTSKLNPKEQRLSYPLLLKCGPLTGNTGITWELLAMQSLKPRPQPPEAESAFYQAQ